jgi:catechol 2,3-dioxygenase-like lactoylglutathione lyase family enzyme
VLRVKDLTRMKDFYSRIIGLELMKEFEGIAFLKVAEGHGGHTQILGMFEEGRPVPIGQPARGPVVPAATALHHSRSRSTERIIRRSWTGSPGSGSR